MPGKNWLIRPTIPDDKRAPLARWNDDPVTQQLFFNRGYYSEEAALRFVYAEPEYDTDPLGLADMDEAVRRIRQALNNHERIAIYGDYDVDGITSTALLVQLLRDGYRADVIPYIPNRFEEGYGLNNEALDTLQTQGVQLVVTVDCGIRSLPEVQHARDIGLDIIVTDHHHLADALPNANAVINPKRIENSYRETTLAGVGVAFKLAQALMAQRSPDDPRINEDTFVDLVALGTVADLAPLTGENRLLVKKGLAEINKKPRTGIAALMKVARVRSPVSAGNIGFQLGPRLNAAGRLDSAMQAYDLLDATDHQRAANAAMRLDEHNQHRQALTQTITDLALELSGALGDDIPSLLIAADASFNAGVVGLAASRLVEQCYRPALVAHVEDDVIVGSARSISEFHITEALDQCADLLERYGGHSMAAGYTVARNNWEPFIARLHAIADAQLADQELRPELKIDAVVTLDQLTDRLAEQLAYFEPTGYGNPAPRFAAFNVPVMSQRTIGSEATHLKLLLDRGDGRSIEALAWRMAGVIPEDVRHVDVAFAFETNTFRGASTLQLNVKDIRPAESPD